MTLEQQTSILQIEMGALFHPRLMEGSRRRGGGREGRETRWKREGGKGRGEERREGRETGRYQMRRGFRRVCLQGRCYHTIHHNPSIAISTTIQIIDQGTGNAK